MTLSRIRDPLSLSFKIGTGANDGQKSVTILNSKIEIEYKMNKIYILDFEIDIE